MVVVAFTSLARILGIGSTIHYPSTLFFLFIFLVEISSRAPREFVQHAQCWFTLNARIVGAPQMTSQPVSSIFLRSPLPWAGKFQACSFPYVVSLPLLLSALFSSSFHRALHMVLARPDERETCPYRFSLRLFTMVRRSSCGSIACRI